MFVGLVSGALLEQATKQKASKIVDRKGEKQRSNGNLLTKIVVAFWSG